MCRGGIKDLYLGGAGAKFYKKDHLGPWGVQGPPKAQHSFAPACVFHVYDEKFFKTKSLRVLICKLQILNPSKVPSARRNNIFFNNKKREFSYRNYVK